MNAHNLNQSGAKVDEKGFNKVDKPPTQQEIARRGHKAKHLVHYHGPAIVQSKVDGRDHQYNITCDGKQFIRDISMLVPDRTYQLLDISRHDPTADTTFQTRSQAPRRRANPMQDRNGRQSLVPCRSTQDIVQRNRGSLLQNTSATVRRLRNDHFRAHL